LLFREPTAEFITVRVVTDRPMVRAVDMTAHQRSAIDAQNAKLQVRQSSIFQASIPAVFICWAPPIA
jgi:hypothetical protein